MTPRTWPCPISWPSVLLLASLGLLLAPSAARAGAVGDPPGSACVRSPPVSVTERYFGFLNRLDPTELLELKHCLLQVVNKCSQHVDQECYEGAEVLKRVFSARRRELPDMILYMSRDGEGRLRSSRPVLQWKGKNRAHLFGSNSIWILVFAEEKLPLEASIVTIYQQTTNPFAGLLSVIGVGTAPSQAKAAEADTTDLSWATMNRTGPPDFFLGTARLPVGTDSVNFVTVGLKESQEKSTVDVSVPRPAAGESVTTVVRRSQEETRKASEEPSEEEEEASADGEVSTEVVESGSGAPAGDPDPLEGADLQPANAASAHFSNSGDSFTAFSVGFAQTADVADTALGQGANSHFNGYAMAKIHVLRPRIKAYQTEGKIQRRSRLSFSFVLGTNLQNDPFEEFVAAVSVGNIIGKTGLLIGLNQTPFLEKKENGVVVERFDREWKLIWGVEYTF